MLEKIAIVLGWIALVACVRLILSWLRKDCEEEADAAEDAPVVEAPSRAPTAPQASVGERARAGVPHLVRYATAAERADDIKVVVRWMSRTVH